MSTDRRPPEPRAEWMFRVVAGIIVFFVTRIMRWRIDVSGWEHIPTYGGAILTFNHHSYGDFYMCAWGAYRRRGRAVKFLAKEELFEKPVLGWVLRKAGQVPVARGSRSGRKEAFAVAVDRLREGAIIAVAPEQTISQSFDLLPFTTGTVRMAQEAGVPIVPGVNWGTQRWATKGRPINWGATGIPVVVRYGEPLHVAPDEDLDVATERLRKTMQDMLDEVQRDYPDEPVPGDDWWQPRRLGGSAPAHADVLRDHLDRDRAWRRRRDAEGDA